MSTEETYYKFRLIRAFTTLKAAEEHLDYLRKIKWGYGYAIQEIGAGI